MSFCLENVFNKVDESVLQNFRNNFFKVMEG